MLHPSVHRSAAASGASAASTNATGHMVSCACARKCCSRNSAARLYCVSERVPVPQLPARKITCSKDPEGRKDQGRRARQGDNAPGKVQIRRRVLQAVRHATAGCRPQRCLCCYRCCCYVRLAASPRRRQRHHRTPARSPRPHVQRPPRPSSAVPTRVAARSTSARKATATCSSTAGARTAAAACTPAARQTLAVRRAFPRTVRAGAHLPTCWQGAVGKVPAPRHRPAVAHAAANDAAEGCRQWPTGCRHGCGRH